MTRERQRVVLDCDPGHDDAFLDRVAEKFADCSRDHGLEIIVARETESVLL